ncbi:antitoxin [Kribbella sp. NPDC051620]|uniref:type II toxin-antitoxin system VapB family antitoxin n=1 Tax=Kribbella sp. NPDC051620 TaxID=3364120 RepID=UPI0037A48C39
MSDVLIRDVPDEVLAVIDHRASHLGLSRSEYLRRQLSQEAGRSDDPVTVADLKRFSQTARDLADPDVMDQAWS